MLNITSSDQHKLDRCPLYVNGKLAKIMASAYGAKNCDVAYAIMQIFEASSTVLLGYIIIHVHFGARQDRRAARLGTCLTFALTGRRSPLAPPGFWGAAPAFDLEAEW